MITSRARAAKRDRARLASIGASVEHVHVTARIASPNAVVSPLSGARASAFLWAFSSREEHPEDPYAERVVQRGVRAWIPSDLEMQVGGDTHIHVPARNVTLIEAVNVGPPMPVERPIPAELGEIAHGGTLLFCETSLSEGDEVELDAWVVRTTPGMAFRSSGELAATPFVVVPEAGPVTLTPHVFETAVQPWARRMLAAMHGDRAANTATFVTWLAAFAAAGLVASVITGVVAMATRTAPVVLMLLIACGAFPAVFIASSGHSSTPVDDGRRGTPVRYMMRFAPPWSVGLWALSCLANVVAGLACVVPRGLNTEIPLNAIADTPGGVAFAVTSCAHMYGAALALALSSREVLRRASSSSRESP